VPYVEVWVDDPAGLTTEQVEAIKELLEEVDALVDLLPVAIALPLLRTAQAVARACDLMSDLQTPPVDEKDRAWIRDRDPPPVRMGEGEEAAQ
jgi:hypothetical protein